MCWGELGSEHHIAVWIDGANLPEAAGLDRQAVGQLAAALIEGQQADPIPIRGADESSIRAETQLFDVASANVGLLNVVGETEGTAGGDERAGGRPLLKLINARPLGKNGEKDGDTVLPQQADSIVSFSNRLAALLVSPTS